jgi:hypothetical protein
MRTTLSKTLLQISIDSYLLQTRNTQYVTLYHSSLIPKVDNIHNVHYHSKFKSNVWKENTYKVFKVGDLLSRDIHFMEVIQVHSKPHHRLWCLLFNQTNIAHDMNIWVDKPFKTHQYILSNEQNPYCKHFFSLNVYFHMKYAMCTIPSQNCKKKNWYDMALTKVINNIGTRVNHIFKYLYK